MLTLLPASWVQFLPSGRCAACLPTSLLAATSIVSLLPAGDCICGLVGTVIVATQALYRVPAGGWPSGLLPALPQVACACCAWHAQVCAHMLLHNGQDGAHCLLCWLQVCFLSDIFPTAWHGTELGDVGEGDTVGIWGCGPGVPRPPATTVAPVPVPAHPCKAASLQLACLHALHPEYEMTAALGVALTAASSLSATCLTAGTAIPPACSVLFWLCEAGMNVQHQGAAVLLH